MPMIMPVASSLGSSGWPVATTWQPELYLDARQGTFDNAWNSHGSLGGAAVELANPPTLEASHPDVNGKPAFDFDGVDDVLNLNKHPVFSQFHSVSAYFFAGVCYVSAMGTANDKNNANYRGLICSHSAYLWAGFGVSEFAVQHYTGSVAYHRSFPAAAGTLYGFWFGFDGGTFSARLSGQATSSVGSLPNLGGEAETNFRIGKTTSGLHLDGAIPLLIAGNSPPGAGDITAIENFANRRFGVSW